jgi:hypothetical protein
MRFSPSPASTIKSKGSLSPQGLATMNPRPAALLRKSASARSPSRFRVTGIRSASAAISPMKSPPPVMACMSKIWYVEHMCLLLINFDKADSSHILAATRLRMARNDKVVGTIPTAYAPSASLRAGSGLHSFAAMRLRATKVLPARHPPRQQKSPSDSTVR